MRNPRILGAEEGPRRLKGVHSKVDPVSYILEMKMKFDSSFKLDQRMNASRRVASILSQQVAMNQRLQSWLPSWLQTWIWLGERKVVE